MPKLALIVEDEPQIASLLSDYMKNAGFETALLSNGGKVIPFVKKRSPDFILLDIMLPEMDGIQICREIRKFSNVPIIFITAKVEEIDRLIGLELGADDYICKPFSPREVVARVKAMLRRVDAGSKAGVSIVKAGNISLDESTRGVTVGETAIDLTPYEFDLLKVLMAHPGRVYSRSELVAKVQGYSYEGYERAIDSHIKNLRKKIAAVLPDADLIQTVYGVGYRLNG
jgi:two-component system response regulator BaeR